MRAFAVSSFGCRSSELGLEQYLELRREWYQLDILPQLHQNHYC